MWRETDVASLECSIHTDSICIFCTALLPGFCYLI